MPSLLIKIGIILILIGVFYPFFQRLGLGRLPGDILISTKNMEFYFPIMSCLVVSCIVSLVIWILNRHF